MSTEADLVITGASQLFTATGDASDPGLIESGALAARQGRIVWVGPGHRLRSEVSIADAARIVDATGCVVTPGFVDPHTHVVFAGSRPHEFEWRLSGRPYLDILADGGGILSTVRAVRQADEDALVAESLPRLQRMLRFGTTTCEVKSGYGLTLGDELKLLRAARRLDAMQPVRLVPTFLGAHAFPPEFSGDHEAYVELVVNEMIPAVAGEGLAGACDAYVDRGVFDTAQAERILRAAIDAGMAIHVHAGQFEDLGAPEMAARLGALSVDHLDVVSDAGIEAMARHGTVAVMLPGASVSLGHEPPVTGRLLAAGVEVALATDCNPGTSYTENLPLMAFIGCTRMGLSCASSLIAITRVAARALGMKAPEGTLAPGARADVVVHEVGDWREILYHFGVTHVRDVFVGGEPALGRG
jgi:imidazolonepropionase